jgi:conjugal transfer pilus assembly protein TraB
MESVLKAWADGKGGTAADLDLPEGPPANNSNLPGPPPTPNAWAANGPNGQSVGTVPVVEFVGEIGTVEIQARTVQQDAQKKNPRYFLPVGFMEAKLLTGVSAKTVESAKGDPEPVLLRVQTPAVLPNEVRAQLDGCFVVAHGYGSLASERFEARTVSISCLDFSGQAMIEAPITGVLVDKDGQKGVTGRPVAKMGANMARLFAAGFVDGAAKGFSSTASITSVSPLGQTQTIDPDRIGRAALGEGLSQGTSELVRIYSDLVRQSSPVLEVGPQKEVTIVITEGAWLEIKPVTEEAA